MANLVTAFYTGSQTAYNNATKKQDALYFIYDGATRFIYKGNTRVAGDFRIVETVPESKEQGVIYYIEKFGTAQKPYVGFWNGRAWKALSDSATIEALDERITTLENDTKIDGSASAGTIGHVVDILTGTTAVTGSVAEQVDSAKKAIEGTLANDDSKTLEAINDELDAIDAKITGMTSADTAVTGKIVKAVSQENGKITVNRDFLADTDVKVVAVTGSELTSLGANVKEAYKLVNGNETPVKLGEYIKVYKDQTLKEIKLVTEWSEKEGKTVPAGTEGATIKKGQGLQYIYFIANGNEESVTVDVSTFLVQSEFKNGLEVSAAGEVSVKIDNASEKVTTAEGVESEVLSVSGDGIKVSNIQDAIDYAVTSKNVAAEGESGATALVTAEAANNKVTIASTDKLKNAVASAETAIQSVSASGDDYVSAKFAEKTDNSQALSVSASTKTVNAIAAAETSIQTLTVNGVKATKSGNANAKAASVEIKAADIEYKANTAAEGQPSNAKSVKDGLDELAAAAYSGITVNTANNKKDSKGNVVLDVTDVTDNGQKVGVTVQYGEIKVENGVASVETGKNGLIDAETVKDALNNVGICWFELV